MIRPKPGIIQRHTSSKLFTAFNIQVWHFIQFYNIFKDKLFWAVGNWQCTFKSILTLPTCCRSQSSISLVPLILSYLGFNKTVARISLCSLYGSKRPVSHSQWCFWTQVKVFSSMASKLINIRLNRTGSEPY